METETTLDLVHLGDLLRLLRDNKVHSFQAGEITVVFNEEEPYTPIVGAAAKKAAEADDGHSTSSKRVGGFKDPALWQHQNGKVLRFNGSLE